MRDLGGQQKLKLFASAGLLLLGEEVEELALQRSPGRAVSS
jgi:hypothetical protein